MRVAEFWDVTLQEVLMFIRADRWRWERREHIAMATAWHTVNLKHVAQSQKRLPALKDFLYPPRTSDGVVHITPKQEWARWEAIATIANAQEALKKAQAAADGVGL